MKKINIFLRKKNSVHHHSIERFAEIISSRIKIDNVIIKIINCPISSNGIFKRIFLILWGFFKQGDVNHILGDVNFISLLMKKNKTINTFLDCRLINEFEGIKKIIYKYFWFIIPIYKSCKCTFISDFTKKEILKFIYLISDKKFEMIPVPLVRNFPIKNISSSNNKILIIGTAEHKNINNMVKATVGLNIDIDIVGDLKEETRFFMKKNNIKYRNYVDISDEKIDFLYKTNAILMMVSKYEGFGMPIVEAQQSGLAVITSNIEPMKSVAGEGAIFVEPHNIFEIRKAIIKLLEDKDYTRKLINTGIYNSNRYKDIFVLDKYKKIYQDMLN